MRDEIIKLLGERFPQYRDEYYAEVADAIIEICNKIPIVDIEKLAQGDGTAYKGDE